MTEPVVNSRQWLAAALVPCLLLIACAPPESIPDVSEFEESAEAPDVRLPTGAKSLAEIVRSLEAAGYSRVISIERVDDQWEIDAYKDGQRVEVLTDAATGEIVDDEQPGPGLPLAGILASLEARGFDQVLGVNRAKDGWEIEAYRGGEAAVVIVDAATGKIIEEE